MKIMKSRALLLTAGLLLALVAPAGHAVLELIEESVEALELEVRVDGSLNGYAAGTQCEGCRILRFKVTPKTIYMRGNQVVDPSQASSFSGKPGTIIFDLKSREVTRILQQK